MNKARNRWGAGPKMFLLSSPFLAMMIATNCIYYPLFIVKAVPPWIFYSAGGVLLGVGIAWWYMSISANRRAMRERRLLTDGMYSLCRHPLYAGWILLIVPGIILFTRSWLLLGYPPILYACFRICIAGEEKQLEDEFADAYRRYKARVNALLPSFRSRFRSKCE